MYNNLINILFNIKLTINTLNRLYGDITIDLYIMRSYAVQLIM